MKKTTFCFLLISALLAACTENSLIIEDNRTGNNNGGATNIIHFYPRIHGYTSGGPANITSFPEGCVVQIFAFVKGIQLTQWRYYQSYSVGTLSPVSLPMELVGGSYDFYMVSLKTAADPPVFHDGSAYGLQNGIDYLWYATPAAVSQLQTNIPVNFMHSASQIVIDVENQDDASIAEWIQYAMLGAPQPDTLTSWDLFSGAIRPVTQIRTDSLINLTADGLSCQSIILPVSGVSQVYLYLNMKINGENEYRGYPFYLPIPDSIFMAGNSYHYNIEFTRDTVLIGDVTISSWIEVDEEGHPLYPESNN